MTTKKFFIIIAIVAAAFGVIGFGVSRLIQKPVIIEKLIDTQKFDRIIDSVVLAGKQAQFIIDEQQKLNDSLIVLLKNKNQHKHETKQIKDFTPTGRLSWHDSVMSSNGLK